MLKASPSPRTLALVVFLATLGVCAFSLSNRRQLGTMGGLTDEWYALGANLRAAGVLGIGDKAIATRPPGYPLFIAAALLPAGRPGLSGFPAYLARGEGLVYLAQALLLAITACMLFLWLAGRIRPQHAFAAAFLFGTNPCSVLLTGLLHYDVLHLFTIVLACVLLDRALRLAGDRTGPWIFAGMAWGAVTLVKPLTFTLPPLLLLVWWHRRRSPKGVVVDASCLALGALLVLAPWFFWNYRATAQVLASDQGWNAVWGSTVEKLDLDPDRYHWDRLASAYWMPLAARASGEPLYTLEAFNRHHAAVEAAVRTDALERLRARPGIYAYNVVRSLATLTLQMNVIFVDVFRDLQDRAALLRHGWHFGSDATPYTRSWLAEALAIFCGVLSAAAIGGVVIGIRAHDPWLLAPLVGTLSLALAHSVLYMDLMYYYVRLPFLFVFAFYAIDRLPARAAAVSVALLGAASLALTVATLR
jgi:4-amino-4-deoxy-L-arabinose transferase-like glycosyltransferase